MTALLRADDVTVARGRTVLLRHFSMELGAGELVHLRGANGSGKSSLMRVLAGVVEARRGSVARVAGCAYMPERVTLPESLPAQRWLRICRAADAQLPAELDRRCGALSNGQQQRVVLTTVLEDRPAAPRLYFLDEPWAGLDAGARGLLDERVAEFVRDGSAVLYTDHGRQTRLGPTRTLDLGPGAPEAETSPPDGRLRVELRRGAERADSVVSDPDLAARLAEGWEVERIEPLS
jgi:heme exporter protein A